jgi:crotonobetainyl-CoA:carnitine CoA-transferase CaiB-like acyl-CoA transferase
MNGPGRAARDADGALAGVRVLDIGTLFAGPLIATLMGDFGADVIKLEHPSGDGVRKLGWQRDGVSLWWAFVARNKRCVSLRLSHPQGRRLALALIRSADVLIESFQPGTLERWGLGPEELLAHNPGLVMVRVSGFGQDGPYSHRPGFGTLAEAISGFAHVNGWPDGPPTLPPIALADSVAALAGTALAMFALWHRASSGRGQVIDLSIFEPLFWILGPQASVYDQLGLVPGRSGNRAPFTAPRNAYRSRDGRWLALSASAQSIAERVMKAIGCEEVIAEPWFADHEGRLAHADQLDELIGQWIAARDAEEVITCFERAQAAIAPILSIAEIFTDPHYRARGTIATVDDPNLGALAMQNLIGRLLATPGEIRHSGRQIGADNEAVFGELGVEAAELERLRAEGVV